MIVDKQNVKAKSVEKDVPKCDEKEAADSEERSFGSLDFCTGDDADPQRYIY